MLISVSIGVSIHNVSSIAFGGERETLLPISCCCARTNIKNVLFFLIRMAK